MTEVDGNRRLELVRTAQQQWIAALTDLGGRNTLLYYLARWDELFLEPAAPVLLRGLTITPTRARYDDFELALDDEEEVNPVLVHKLTSVFGAELAKLTPQDAAGQLRQAAARAEVPGFEISARQVIGTFTYAKLPMVRDMEAAGDLLAESDLVAAIAGDAEAQQLVAADHPAREDSDSPEDDYSVLDADSSQRHAIDTVLSRLKGVELGDMVLDIHEGTRDRQRRPVPDDPGRRGRRGVLPRLRRRPRPGPAAQGAPGAARLALPPALVHQLVPRPRHRGGQAPRGLRPGRRRLAPRPPRAPRGAFRGTPRGALRRAP